MHSLGSRRILLYSEILSVHVARTEAPRLYFAIAGLCTLSRNAGWSADNSSVSAAKAVYYRE